MQAYARQSNQLHISQGMFPPHVPGAGMPTPTSVVMAPILAWQFCKLQAPPFHKGVGAGVPQALQEKPIVTPQQAEAWRKALAPHNDREWVAALVSGMQHGFRIGL